MSDIPVDADAGAVDAPVEDTGPADFGDLEASYDALEQTAGLPEQTLAEIRKLRAEHKKYRERFSPFEQTFSGLHPDDAQALLSFAQTFASGNVDDAVRWMLGNAKGLAGDRWNDFYSEIADAVAEAVEEAESAADSELLDNAADSTQNVEELVAKAVADALARRDEETREAEAIRGIELELKELGYEPGSQQATFFLTFAKTNGTTDLKVAHEAYQTFLADQAKDFLAAKQASDGANGTLTGDPVSHDNTENLTPEQRVRARIQAAFAADKSIQGP